MVFLSAEDVLCIYVVVDADVKVTPHLGYTPISISS